MNNQESLPQGSIIVDRLQGGPPMTRGDQLCIHRWSYGDHQCIDADGPPDHPCVRRWSPPPGPHLSGTKFCMTGVYVVRTLSLNDKYSCQLFRKASSLVLLSSSVSMANLSYLLATTFSSLRFLFNFTSLQSFESGQRGFLFSHFRVLSFLSSVLSSLKLSLL